MSLHRFLALVIGHSIVDSIACHRSCERSGNSRPEATVGRCRHLIHRLVDDGRVLLHNGRALRFELYWDRVEQNIRRQAESIPPEERQEPSIGMTKTVLDGLAAAIENEDLQKLFLNLLCGSMDKRSASGILPVYADILKQMCPDEALLMRYFASLPTQQGPILEVRAASTSLDEGFVVKQTNFSLFGFYANCNNPQNTPIYLDNLQRLGLITLSFEKHLVDNNAYDQLEHFNEIEQLKESIEADQTKKCDFSHGIMTLTNFGASFCKACKITETI